jgi:hypothetical protein
MLSDLAGWVQVIAGLATFAAACVAYWTLAHMRRSSAESALRASTARTHHDCRPICTRAIARFQKLVRGLRNQPITEADPKHIAKVLNLWETVAAGINSGIYGQELFYLLARQPVLMHYRSLSWYVRQQRQTNENAYNELEKLIDHINEIDSSTFSVTNKSLAALRSSSVPANVLKVVRKAASLSNSTRDDHKDARTAEKSPPIGRMMRLLVSRESHGDTWNIFEDRLNDVASGQSVPIALYKPLIFACTRRHPLHILQLNSSRLDQHLGSNDLQSFKDSEVEMYRHIYSLTGGTYPFDIENDKDNSLLKWCEAERNLRLCQLVIFDRHSDKDRRRRRILGHIAVSELKSHRRWSTLIPTVQVFAGRTVESKLDPSTCLVAHDLYFDTRVDNAMRGKAVLRALLRRAIQLVEESHLLPGRQRHWLLLGLVRPKLERYATSAGAQRQVVEDEGGRFLGQFTAAKGAEIDIYLFGQSFKSVANTGTTPPETAAS